MQMVKKIVVGFFVILIAFLAFMPKVELYYLLEKELVKYDVKINEKSIEEGIFSLTLNNVSIFAKGIHIADIDKIEVISFLVYNNIVINNIVFDELLKGQAPKKIDYINILHSVEDIMNIVIDANGTLGTVSGGVDLNKQKVRVNFSSINELRNIQSFLKKDKKGWYYEKSF